MDMKLRTRTWSRPSRGVLGALASIALAAVACGGSELEQNDLGNTTVSDSTERTSLIQEDGEVDPFIAGHWLGEAEDLFSPPGADGRRPPYTFPSGSKQVTLDLSFGDPLQNILSPAVAGRITFGAGPVPEPTAGGVYPPGLTQTYGDLAAIPPLEGFAYNLAQASGAANGALPVGYTATQSYRDWCPMQPARSDGSGNFDCITEILPPDLPPSGALCSSRQSIKDPTSGITFGKNLSYDCSVHWLCQACQCSKTGCMASYSEPPVQLWLIRSGQDLLGNFARAVFDYGDGQNYLPVGNVRFQRQN
jgi:hypothetical protein